MFNRPTNREMVEALLRATPWFFILLLPVIYYSIHQQNEQKLINRALHNNVTNQPVSRLSVSEPILSDRDTITFSRRGRLLKGR